MKQTKQRGGELYILATAILWSTGGLFIKLVPWNPMVINGVRSLIAAMVMMAYLRRVRLRVNRTIFLAAMSTCLTNILFVYSNKLTTAANAIVLQYTAPIFVIVFTVVFLKKKPSRAQCICTAVCFLGILLFFIDQIDGGGMLGNILAVLAGVTFAGVYFCNGLPGASPEDSSLLAYWINVVLCIPFLGAQPVLPTVGILALLGMGFFQLGLSYVLFSIGIRRTSSVTASLIGIIEAMLNPVWVFLVTGERPGLFALIGAVIVLCSIVCNMVLEKRQNAYQLAEAQEKERMRERELERQAELDTGHAASVQVQAHKP